jgi:cation/acetate symporter
MTPFAAIGDPSAIAIFFFCLFILVALVISYWAARRTKTTEQFYAAGHEVSGFQNGLALAGDYMSAASFLGIAGLVALYGSTASSTRSASSSAGRSSSS